MWSLILISLLLVSCYGSTKVSANNSTTEPEGSVNGTFYKQSLNCTCPPNNSTASVGEIKYITSPNYPNNYCDSFNCDYHIWAPDGMAIRFEFIDGETEQGYDYIWFLGEKTWRYSGFLSYQLVYVKQSYVRISFQSDEVVTRRGFNISYRAIPMNSNFPDIDQDDYRKLVLYCEDSSGLRVYFYEATPPILTATGRTPFSNCTCPTSDFTASEGMIQSTNYPFGYCNNMNCNYSIQAPEGFVIKIDLEGFTEKCCDFIFVFNSSSIKNGYGGQLNGTVIISDLNRVDFRFRTDSSYTLKGFRAYYKFIKDPQCLNGGILTDKSSGCFCPHPYHGKYCEDNLTNVQCA